MSKKAGILGVAIGAIAAVAAVGTVKYIDEQKQVDKRKKAQVNNDKLIYDPKQQNAISILSHHGKFISSPDIKSKSIKANCTAKIRSNQQTFISIPIPQENNDNNNDKEIKVALRTYDGKYLSAQPKNGAIESNRDNIGKWEIFTVERYEDKKSGSDLWAFKSCHGKYLSAEWFTGLLYANRDKADNWEKFSVQIVDWDDDDW